MTTGGSPTRSEPDPLVFPMNRRRITLAVFGCLAAVALGVGLAVQPGLAGSRETLVVWSVPTRSVLLACAVVFLAFTVLGVVALIRRNPLLVVDLVGFHQRSRTIRWDDLRALRIEILTFRMGLYKAAHPRLLIEPVAGKRIVVAEPALVLSADDAMAQIRHWSIERRGIDPLQAAPLATQD